MNQNLKLGLIAVVVTLLNQGYSQLTGDNLNMECQAIEKMPPIDAKPDDSSIAAASETNADNE